MPVKHYHILDMQRDIVTVARAVRDKTLQCYARTRAATCRYTGPCAIGVCLPQEIRGRLDHCRNRDLPNLLESGRMTVASGNSGEMNDWCRLQSSHDTLVNNAWDDAKVLDFEMLVSRLLKRYAPDAVL